MPQSTEKSTHYAIKGRHLKDLRAALRCTSTHLQSLFGWSSSQWNNMSIRGETPRKDLSESSIKQTQMALPVRHCLLIRTLTEHPELDPTPKKPTSNELLATIRLIDPTFTDAEFPILLGYELTNKEALANGTSNPVPAVENYMLIIKNCLESAPTMVEKKRWLDYFKSNVDAEAISRGVSPERIWKKGGWTQPE